MISNVYVWGESNKGLLGLGFKIREVSTPTQLNNLSKITKLGLSENHAIALNVNGECFSWGTGNYGELCLESSVFSPYPCSFNNNKKYIGVYCGELITCLIDSDNKFSYFGIIIRSINIKGEKSLVTIKNLLLDQSINNPEELFEEKTVVELENERFKYISIANGYLALLSTNGIVFTLDYSDNITLHYSNHPVKYISTSNDILYGFAYSNVNKTDNKHSNICYLCKWSVEFKENKELNIDTWKTHIYQLRKMLNYKNLKLIDSFNSEFLLLMYNSNSNYNNNSNKADKINDITIMFPYNNLPCCKLINTFDYTYNIIYKRNNKLLERSRLEQTSFQKLKDFYLKKKGICKSLNMDFSSNTFIGNSNINSNNLSYADNNNNNINNKGILKLTNKSSNLNRSFLAINKFKKNSDVESNEEANNNYFQQLSSNNTQTLNNDKKTNYSIIDNINYNVDNSINKNNYQNSDIIIKNEMNFSISSPEKLKIITYKAKKNLNSSELSKRNSVEVVNNKNIYKSPQNIKRSLFKSTSESQNFDSKVCDKKIDSNKNKDNYKFSVNSCDSLRRRLQNNNKIINNKNLPSCNSNNNNFINSNSFLYNSKKDMYYLNNNFNEDDFVELNSNNKVNSFLNNISQIRVIKENNLINKSNSEGLNDNYEPFFTDEDVSILENNNANNINNSNINNDNKLNKSNFKHTNTNIKSNFSPIANKNQILKKFNNNNNNNNNCKIGYNLSNLNTQADNLKHSNNNNNNNNKNFSIGLNDNNLKNNIKLSTISEVNYNNDCLTSKNTSKSKISKLNFDSLNNKNTREAKNTEANISNNENNYHEYISPRFVEDNISNKLNNNKNNIDSKINKVLFTYNTFSNKNEITDKKNSTNNNNNSDLYYINKEKEISSNSLIDINDKDNIKKKVNKEDIACNNYNNNQLKKSLSEYILNDNKNKKLQEFTSIEKYNSEEDSLKNCKNISNISNRKFSNDYAFQLNREFKLRLPEANYKRKRSSSNCINDNILISKKNSNSYLSIIKLKAKFNCINKQYKNKSKSCNSLTINRNSLKKLNITNSNIDKFRYVLNSKSCNNNYNNNYRQHVNNKDNLFNLKLIDNLSCFNKIKSSHELRNYNTNINSNFRKEFINNNNNNNNLKRLHSMSNLKYNIISNNVLKNNIEYDQFIPFRNNDETNKLNFKNLLNRKTIIKNKVDLPFSMNNMKYKSRNNIIYNNNKIYRKYSIDNLLNSQCKSNSFSYSRKNTCLPLYLCFYSKDMYKDNNNVYSLDKLKKCFNVKNDVCLDYNKANTTEVLLNKNKLSKDLACRANNKYNSAYNIISNISPNKNELTSFSKFNSLKNQYRNNNLNINLLSIDKTSKGFLDNNTFGEEVFENTVKNTTNISDVKYIDKSNKLINIKSNNNNDNNFSNIEDNINGEITFNNKFFNKLSINNTNNNAYNTANCLNINKNNYLVNTEISNNYNNDSNKEIINYIKSHKLNKTIDVCMNKYRRNSHLNKINSYKLNINNFLYSDKNLSKLCNNKNKRHNSLPYNNNNNLLYSNYNNSKNNNAIVSNRFTFKEDITINSNNNDENNNILLNNADKYFKNKIDNKITINDPTLNYNPNSYFNLISKIKLSINILTNIFTFYDKCSNNQLKIAFNLIIDFSNSKIRKNIIKNRNINFINSNENNVYFNDISRKNYTENLMKIISNNKYNIHKTKNEYYDYTKLFLLVKIIVRIIIPKIKIFKNTIGYNFINNDIKILIFNKNKKKKLNMLYRIYYKNSIQKYYLKLKDKNYISNGIKLIIHAFLNYYNKNFNIYDTIDFKSKLKNIRKKQLNQIINSINIINQNNIVFKCKFLNKLIFIKNVSRKKPLILRFVVKTESFIRNKTFLNVFKKLFYYKKYIDIYYSNIIVLLSKILTIKKNLLSILFTNLKFKCFRHSVLNHYINLKIKNEFIVKKKKFKKFVNCCINYDYNFFNNIKVKKLYKIYYSYSKRLLFKTFYNWERKLFKKFYKIDRCFKYNIHKDANYISITNSVFNSSIDNLRSINSISNINNNIEKIKSTYTRNKTSNLKSYFNSNIASKQVMSNNKKKHLKNIPLSVQSATILNNNKYKCNIKPKVDIINNIIENSKTPNMDYSSDFKLNISNDILNKSKLSNDYTIGKFISLNAINALNNKQKSSDSCILNLNEEYKKNINYNRVNSNIKSRMSEVNTRACTRINYSKNSSKLKCKINDNNINLNKDSNISSCIPSGRNSVINQKSSNLSTIKSISNKFNNSIKNKNKEYIISKNKILCENIINKYMPKKKFTLDNDYYNKYINNEDNNINKEEFLKSKELNFIELLKSHIFKNFINKYKCLMLSILYVRNIIHKFNTFENLFKNLQIKKCFNIIKKIYLTLIMNSKEDVLFNKFIIEQNINNKFIDAENEYINNKHYKSYISNNKLPISFNKLDYDNVSEIDKIAFASRNKYIIKKSYISNNNNNNNNNESFLNSNYSNNIDKNKTNNNSNCSTNNPVIIQNIDYLTESKHIYDAKNNKDIKFNCVDLCNNNIQKDSNNKDKNTSKFKLNTDNIQKHKIYCNNNSNVYNELNCIFNNNNNNVSICETIKDFGKKDNFNKTNNVSLSDINLEEDPILNNIKPTKLSISKSKNQIDINNCKTINNNVNNKRSEIIYKNALIPSKSVLKCIQSSMKKINKSNSKQKLNIDKISLTSSKLISSNKNSYTCNNYIIKNSNNLNNSNLLSAHANNKIASDNNFCVKLSTLITVLDLTNTRLYKYKFFILIKKLLKETCIKENYNKENILVNSYKDIIKIKNKYAAYIKSNKFRLNSAKLIFRLLIKKTVYYKLSFIQNLIKQNKQIDKRY